VVNTILWQNSFSTPIVGIESIFIVKKKKMDETNELIVYINKGGTIFPTFLKVNTNKKK